MYRFLFLCALEEVGYCGEDGESLDGLWQKLAGRIGVEGLTDDAKVCGDVWRLGQTVT